MARIRTLATPLGVMVASGLLIATASLAGCSTPSSTSGGSDGYDCEQAYNDVIDATGGVDHQTSDYKDNWISTCESQHGG